MDKIIDLISSLLIQLIKNSINASLLIVLILIFRLIFKNRIKIGVISIIWFILIIRLVLPFDLQIFKLFTIDETYLIVSEIPLISNTGMLFRINNIDVQEFHFSIINYASIIWSILILFFIFKKTFISLIFSLKIKHGKILQENKIKNILSDCLRQLKLKNNISIIETNMVNAPCIYGFFRYKILFPEGLYESLKHEELKCVLLHELSHVKNFDLPINLFINLLNIIYFFNPLIIFALNTMKKDREILCDKNAISFLNDDYLIYGNTLIKILEFIKLKNYSCRLPGISGMPSAINNKKHIKRRLFMICNRSKKSSFISLLIILILFLTAGYTFVGSVFAETINNDVHPDFISPVEKPNITALFGMRLDPITNRYDEHTGVDLAKKEGSPVKASAEGKVVKIEEDINNDTGYGKYIIIAHNDGYTTYYTKLSKINVKENQTVKSGELIALTGTTGKTTGPHIHFEIRKDNMPLNPQNFIDF